VEAFLIKNPDIRLVILTQLMLDLMTLSCSTNKYSDRLFSSTYNPCTDCKSAQKCTNMGHFLPFPKVTSVFVHVGMWRQTDTHRDRRHHNTFRLVCQKAVATPYRIGLSLTYRYITFINSVPVQGRNLRLIVQQWHISRQTSTPPGHLPPIWFFHVSRPRRSGPI